MSKTWKVTWKPIVVKRAVLLVVYMVRGCRFLGGIQVSGTPMDLGNVVLEGYAIYRMCVAGRYSRT